MGALNSVRVLCLVLLLSLVAMLGGCADSPIEKSQQTEQTEDSGQSIDWASITPAEVETLIEQGELDPNGFVMSKGERKVPLYHTMKVVINGSNPDVLDVFVKHGADIDKQVKEYKLTALDFALYNGKIDMAQRLLELGAVFQKDDVTKEPSIFYTLISKKLTVDTRKKMIDLLLRYGADINAFNYHSQQYSVVLTPLMQAIGLFLTDKYQENYSGLISYMVSRGADINILPPGSGVTAMHLAVSGDDVGVIEELIELGGDTNILNANGCWTPLLYFAVFGQNMEIFDLLISKGANLDHSCANGENILDFIDIRKSGDSGSPFESYLNIDREQFPTDEVWRGFGETILSRIEMLCEEGSYALCKEIAGHIDWHSITSSEVKGLIEQGALDPKGIFVGVGKSRVLVYPLQEAAKKSKDPDVLEVLIEAGANIEQRFTPRSNDGLSFFDKMKAELRIGRVIREETATALQWTIFYGRTEMARRLLELGANINTEDKPKDRDAIIYTLLNPSLELEDRKEMIDLLLSYRADINAVMYASEETGLTYLMSYLLVDLFIVEDFKANYKGLISYIVSRGADINKLPPGDSLTAMHLAVWSEDVGVIEELIALGGDVNVVADFEDFACLTPLGFFVLFGQSIEVFDVLLSEGARFDFGCEGEDWSMQDVIELRTEGDDDIYEELLQDLNERTMKNPKLNVEQFPPVASWRAFGLTIKSRLETLCVEESHEICKELEEEQ